MTVSGLDWPPIGALLVLGHGKDTELMRVTGRDGYDVTVRPLTWLERVAERFHSARWHLSSAWWRFRIAAEDAVRGWFRR